MTFKGIKGQIKKLTFYWISFYVIYSKLSDLML